MFDMAFAPKDKIAHNNATIQPRRPHVDQDCGANRIFTTAALYSIPWFCIWEIGRFPKSVELLPARGLCLSCVSTTHLRSFCFQFHRWKFWLPELASWYRSHCRLPAKCWGICHICLHGAESEEMWSQQSCPDFERPQISWKQGAWVKATQRQAKPG